MGILNTGTTGLLAFQRSLATISHNISNATREGYSRQRVELESCPSCLRGGQFIGQGVKVSTIRRIQSEFIDVQLRDSLASAASGETRAQYAERIDRLLGDDDTGLAPAMRNLFNAANDVASDPTSTTNRTVLLNEAESTVQRFNQLSLRIEEQRELINRDIMANVDEINTLAETVRDLNQRIVAGYGLTASRGGEPNDLLDERGQALAEMAALLDIKSIEQDNGAVNVFIGSGQPLVMGEITNGISVANTLGDVRNLGVAFQTADGTAKDITDLISGGELGGLIDVRKDVLDSAQNGIGQIAVVMSAMLNSQSALGLDIDGNLGEPMFNTQDIYVGALPGNASGDYPDVQFNDTAIGDLTASDYSLTFDGADFQLLRHSDNQIVADSSGGDLLKVDGLLIDTSTIGGAQQHDEWLIQPTRLAAEQIAVEMVDPDKVAAAAGATAGPFNSGAARMLDLRIADDTDDNLRVPAGVVFDAVNDEYLVYSPEDDDTNDGATIESFVITDGTMVADDSVTYQDGPTQGFVLGTGLFVPLDQTGTTTISANGWELNIRGTPADGAAFDVAERSTTAREVDPPPPTTVAANGWEFDITGLPADGDTFGVELSQGREGDNRNMLALAGLAEASTIQGQDSFSDSYDNTLGLVGTRTRQAQMFRDSSAALREQAQNERDELSGVNLDEEAAKLLKYQKAYQAASQVISVANQLFDTLFAAVGR